MDKQYRPKHDSRNMVYIDIDVSDVTPMIEKQIKIDYSTREYANAVPNPDYSLCRERVWII